MQSAFHNLNVYTPWLHLSSQSTNTNKSIKMGYQPCLLCHLTANFAGVVSPPPPRSPIFRKYAKTNLSVRKTHNFENTVDGAVRNHIKKSQLKSDNAQLQSTHTHTKKETQDTTVLPLIASVPSSHSQRAANTNQISTSHPCVPCLRYCN